MTEVSGATALQTTWIEEQHLHGAVELVHGQRGLLPHRLPARARAQLHDPGTASVVAAPAGVRLRLRTAAQRLLMQVLPTDLGARQDPTRPSPAHDVLVDGALIARAVARPGGPEHAPWTVDLSGAAPGALLPDGEKLVEIWLPYEEPAELISLRSDAPVYPVASAGRIDDRALSRMLLMIETVMPRTPGTRSSQRPNYPRPFDALTPSLQ